MERIDLHMHSTVSDGTDAPAELLRHVREAGITLFALTDHDAVRGCRMIRELRAADDPKLVTGVEFSCRDEEGKYHILGYRFDPDSAAIREVVDLGHRYRMEKTEARIAFLRDRFGFTFTEGDTESLLALDNPGKPHIGNLMVQYGYAPTKEAAIREYLNQAHFPDKYIRPEEAIRGILGAGGIPVLAHPISGSGDELIMGPDLEDRVRRLTAYGLQGLEAFYSGYAPKQIRQILDLAEQYRLYVTAGSDYHGANKSIIRLGETNMEMIDEVPEGLTRFLEQVV